MYAVIFYVILNKRKLHYQKCYAFDPSNSDDKVIHSYSCNEATLAIINPRRACAARVTVVVLCVCVCVCV